MVAPTTPTFSLTDQADNTGINVVITGGTGTQTNTIYYAQVDSQFNQSDVTWTTDGTQVGTGTYDLSVTAGHFWVYVAGAEDSQIAVASPQFLAATTGSAAYAYQCLTALQSKLQTLSAGGSLAVASASIVIRKIGDWNPDDSQSLPMLVIAMNDPEIIDGARSNINEDQIVYVASLGYFAADNQDNETSSEYAAPLIERQTIRQALLEQSITGVTNSSGEEQVSRITIGTKAALFPEKWRQSNLFAWGLSINFWVREPRGI